MTDSESKTFTAFLGHEVIAKGDVETVVEAAKSRLDAGATQRLAIFDDVEARVHDFDFWGTLEEALARLDAHSLLPERRPVAGGGKTPRTGPGRPKLGVVSKEVTLLPRHWTWLGEQRGSASATLGRLVEEARKREAPGERARKAQEATYRFMSDMAADLPGFDEASRAFFAGDFEGLSARISAWPKDVKDHVGTMVQRQKALQEGWGRGIAAVLSSLLSCRSLLARLGMYPRLWPERVGGTWQVTAWMIIIHVMTEFALPRSLTAAVQRVARVMPVVVVTGARQTGKTTLVRELLPGRRVYHTLDDLDIRTLAERTPEELVERPGSIILDEVQRVPGLLHAVKQAVDHDRRPGRFVLTGSANLLLMRSVSESLAGRAGYLTLWPMTRRERTGRGSSGLWSELFEHPVETWLELLRASDPDPGDWRQEATVGGYPVPAVLHTDPGDRAIWFDGYVRTYLERDLQNLSSIDNLVDFRRLMRATSHRLGQLVNQTELGRDVALPQPTVRRWLNLLEASYQLVRLPAYAVNRTKRLIKTPKAYWSDTGLALRLAGTAEPTGAHLENLVLSDLVAWSESCVPDRPDLYYWRTATGQEVDLVVELGAELLGIEVTATVTPQVADASHLRTFREEYGDAVRGCILLHGGSEIEWLGPRILAVPWWRVI